MQLVSKPNTSPIDWQAVANSVFLNLDEEGVPAQRLFETVVDKVIDYRPWQEEIINTYGPTQDDVEALLSVHFFNCWEQHIGYSRSGDTPHDLTQMQIVLSLNEALTFGVAGLIGVPVEELSEKNIKDFLTAFDVKKDMSTIVKAGRKAYAKWAKAADGHECREEMLEGGR